MEDDFDEIFGINDDNIETIEEPNENNRDNRDTDENESSNQDTKRIVKPKKVVVRPQPKLDATRLTGPRGIGLLENTFNEIKLKGKGHEKEDLDNVMKALEHWAHRLFPKMSFDDCIDKLEDLGSKKNVMVHVTKMRLGMEEPESQILIDDTVPEVHDPFDKLLNNKPREPSLTEEQKARMMKNRLLAEERRMERMKAAIERNKVANNTS